MRKLFISLLLASAVATPALANGPTSEERAAAREQRQASRQESRSERQESRSDARSERTPSFAPERSFTPTPRYQGPDRSFSANRDASARPDRDSFRAERQQWQAPSRPDRQRPTFENSTNRDSVANWRQNERQQIRQDRVERQDQREQNRLERQANRAPTRVTPPSYARPDRPAPPPPTAAQYNPSSTPRWNTSWHRDPRYDWRNHRRHHRSLFHLGFYFDPFGWNYQRYGVGWRLWPSYYGQSYWLDDPFMYNLPYAPWPYRWVRYYNDALLVNTFTGQVVDVAYDFFW